MSLFLVLAMPLLVKVENRRFSIAGRHKLRPKLFSPGFRQVSGYSVFTLPKPPTGSETLTFAPQQSTNTHDVRVGLLKVLFK
jgi:hypothetical protein